MTGSRVYPEAFVASANTPLRSAFSSSTVPVQPIQEPPRFRRIGAIAVINPPDPGSLCHFPSSVFVNTTDKRFETMTRRFPALPKDILFLQDHAITDTARLMPTRQEG